MLERARSICAVVGLACDGKARSCKKKKGQPCAVFVPMSESWKLPGKLCDSRLSASATATQHGSLPRQLGPQIRCGSVAKQEYSAAGTLYCIWVLPSPWWNARKNPTCCMPSGRSIVRSIIALHFRLANVLFATMTVYQLVCPLI